MSLILWNPYKCNCCTNDEIFMFLKYYSRTFEKSLDGDMTKVSDESDQDIKCWIFWFSNILYSLWIKAIWTTFSCWEPVASTAVAFGSVSWSGLRFMILPWLMGSVVLAPNSSLCTCKLPPCRRSEGDVRLVNVVELSAEFDDEGFMVWWEKCRTTSDLATSKQARFKHLHREQTAKVFFTAV